MAESNQFFYDSQVRRFIIQFIRIFSGWQVQFGETSLKSVPIIYGDPSRQAATILRENSENTLLGVPAMAAYVTDLDYDRKRIQSPGFVDKRHVRMRHRDVDTGELTTEQGNAFTIERIMPVPYILKMKLDIWTSNTTQKLQILEQILTLFNPSFEIQSSDNYFDWTSLTTVKLEGNSWSSRTVPVMASTAIDINTATFSIPIWISPPSKVKKLGIIHRVVSSVYDLELDDNVNEMSGFDDNLLMGSRVRVAPLNFNLLLLNNELTLFRNEEFVVDSDPTLGVDSGEFADNSINTADSTSLSADAGFSLPTAGLTSPVAVTANPKPSWDLVFAQYEGKICPGISQMVLLLPDEINEVIGSITQDPNDPNKLFYVIDQDTIPANDLTAIDAVIDPLRSGPNTGLPTAILGQRYLLVDDIGDDGNTSLATADQDNILADSDIITADITENPVGAITPMNYAEAWVGATGNQLIAKKDDIIEYDGTDWIVDFDALASIDETHFVTNLTTLIQYTWTLTKWIKSYEVEYKAGSWQIIF